MVSGQFWAGSPDHLLARLQTGTEGLSEAEAARRLQTDGYNRLEPQRGAGVVGLLLSQFQNPIVLLLIFAAGLSLFLGEVVGATIILVIVLASGLLGFWQEKGASDAVDELLAVVRDGRRREVPLEEVVPGDVAVLSAGDSVPADCRILDSGDLHVDEATLTGETYPVEKEAGDLAAGAPLAKRTNCIFMGTHVVSGTATVVVAKTGKATEFGKVSQRLRPPETEFERGLRRFGYLLVRLTLLLTLAIFVVNVYFERPVVDSFLFSLALAVGLTPQLLPAIRSVTLSHGARRMVREKVIVKRLASIENFGSMDVLCSDKTGTITEGRVRLRSSMNLDGEESERVFLHAYLNASFESGYRNPIGEAIPALHAADVAKEAADIVLLEKDLGVLAAGVGEGRATFANTLKYVFITTSANFGNMFSMAGLSLLIPCLPLFPKQILLINFLTDFPAMTIASDSVDKELVDKPRRWNVRFIRNFMITFGLVSSVFDFLTFGVLLLVLGASVGAFRTGWFVESVVTELLTLLIVRTRRPFSGATSGAT